jgi:8-oxo-dGTP diphosphatase
MKKQYVVGFMFSANKGHVVLIRKNRPDWQKGKLNGVGGKIELGEFPIKAMIREFQEETGVDTNILDWRLFATMEGPESKIYLYTGTSEPYCKGAQTVTDEHIDYYPSSDFDIYNCVPNLKWLIPMAKYENPLFAEVTFEKE